MEKQAVLWDEAYAGLSDADKEQVNFNTSDKHVILEQLSRIVKSKTESAIKSRWKFKNRNGQTIVIRDLLDKLAHYLRKFAQIGDVAVQYDPVHAALPWAGVRFLLMVRIGLQLRNKR